MFVFSSRRRHTRCLSDWSSDVVLFRSNSHPKSHHPIPFAIIPSQFQIPSQIPFKSILAYSDRRRMEKPPFELAHRDESNGGIIILLRPLDAELIGKMSSNRRFSTFGTM